MEFLNKTHDGRFAMLGLLPGEVEAAVLHADGHVSVLAGSCVPLDYHPCHRTGASAAAEIDAAVAKALDGSSEVAELESATAKLEQTLRDRSKIEGGLAAEESSRAACLEAGNDPHGHRNKIDEHRRRLADLEDLIAVLSRRQHEAMSAVSGIKTETARRLAIQVLQSRRTRRVDLSNRLTSVLSEIGEQLVTDRAVLAAIWTEDLGPLDPALLWTNTPTPPAMTAADRRRRLLGNEPTMTPPSNLAPESTPEPEPAVAPSRRRVAYSESLTPQPVGSPPL